MPVSKQKDKTKIAELLNAVEGDLVKVEVNISEQGLTLYLNDYRVSGPKCGGRSGLEILSREVEKVPFKYILEALSLEKYGIRSYEDIVKALREHSQTNNTRKKVKKK